MTKTWDFGGGLLLSIDNDPKMLVRVMMRDDTRGVYVVHWFSRRIAADIGKTLIAELVNAD